MRSQPGRASARCTGSVLCFDESAANSLLKCCVFKRFLVFKSVSTDSVGKLLKTQYFRLCYNVDLFSDVSEIYSRNTSQKAKFNGSFKSLRVGRTDDCIVYVFNASANFIRSPATLLAAVCYSVVFSLTPGEIVFGSREK